jgi:hypothetical protein
MHLRYRQQRALSARKYSSGITSPSTSMRPPTSQYVSDTCEMMRCRKAWDTLHHLLLPAPARDMTYKASYCVTTFFQVLLYLYKQITRQTGLEPPVSWLIGAYSSHTSRTRIQTMHTSFEVFESSLGISVFCPIVLPNKYVRTIFVLSYSTIVHEGSDSNVPASSTMSSGHH